jgi:uncharacterized membrane protein YidH (DUF202 family)
MIQRIQTIFLVLTAGAFLSLFELPFATTNVAAANALSDQAFDVSDHVILLILAALGGLLAIVSIFMFKKRKTQLSLGYLLIILGILIPVAAYFTFMGEAQALPESAQISDGFGAYLPFAAIIFAVAANYFIKKDEKTVRSMDRLR